MYAIYRDHLNINYKKAKEKKLKADFFFTFIFVCSQNTECSWFVLIPPQKNAKFTQLALCSACNKTIGWPEKQHTRAGGKWHLHFSNTHTHTQSFKHPHSIKAFASSSLNKPSDFRAVEVTHSFHLEEKIRITECFTFKTNRPTIVVCKIKKLFCCQVKRQQSLSNTLVLQLRAPALLQF